MDWIFSSSNTYCEWVGYLEFKILLYIIADVILEVILEIASAISFHGISPNFQLRGEIYTGKESMSMIVV